MSFYRTPSYKWDSSSSSFWVVCVCIFFCFYWKWFNGMYLIKKNDLNIYVYIYLKCVIYKIKKKTYEGRMMRFKRVSESKTSEWVDIVVRKKYIYRWIREEKKTYFWDKTTEKQSHHLLCSSLLSQRLLSDVVNEKMWKSSFNQLFSFIILTKIV